MDAELSNAVGITPARAGKRDASLLLEKLPYGSPPRGQGKVLAAGLHNLIDRITPAWAGKRGPGPVKLGRSRDHPRVGGEKSDPGVVTNSIKGSPPRGRGKAAAFAFASCCFGITPAWAGKSCPEWRGMLRSGDHPRVGGEKCVSGTWLKCLSGSPPRGRGKGAATVQIPRERRITPAWAGKSCCSSSAFCIRWDHPRMGGEKFRRQGAFYCVLGSPPHGRGKSDPTDRNRPAFRTTPAWAGKSGRSHHLGQHVRDHPRVGGEK